MEAVFIRDGHSVRYCPETTVPAGTVVVQNNLIAIAKNEITQGHCGTLSLEGVYDEKKTNCAFSVGEYVYWDTTAQKATNVVTGNVCLGIVTRTASATAATVEVRLAALSAQPTEPVNDNA